MAKRNRKSKGASRTNVSSQQNQQQRESKKETAAAVEQAQIDPARQFLEDSEKLERLRSELSKYESLWDNVEALKAQVRDDVRAEEDAIIRKEYRESEEKRIQEMVSKAEKEARGIIESAQNKRDIMLREAESEAARIKSNAESEAEAKLAAANKEAEVRVAAEMAEIEQAREALSQREALIAQQEELIAKRERDVGVLESDLKLETMDLQALKDRLKEQWSLCSPERVRIAENEIELMKKFIDTDKATIEALQKESARLRDIVNRTQGVSVEPLMQELDANKQKVAELSDQLSQYPSMDEIARLRSDAERVSALESERTVLRNQLIETKAHLSRLDACVREAEQKGKEADALRLLNDDLRRSLEELKRGLEVSQEMPCWSTVDHRAAAGASRQQ